MCIGASNPISVVLGIVSLVSFIICGLCCLYLAINSLFKDHSLERSGLERRIANEPTTDKRTNDSSN